MNHNPYRELRTPSDYDLRKTIKNGNMALGDFFRKKSPLDVAVLQDFAHSGDQLVALMRLFEACHNSFQRQARGGFASEAIVGREPFAKALTQVEYAYYDAEVAQLESDYRRRKFWYTLLTLGLGKNPPEEPRQPDHPLLIALDGLICSGLVECLENPDTPNRIKVVFPSCELVKRLHVGERRATAG